MKLPTLTEKIATLYKAGKKLVDIRDTCQTGIVDIYWHLGRANVQIGRSRGTRPKGDREQLKEQLREGNVSIRLLSKEHGVSTERIRQIAHKIGVTSYDRKIKP